MKNLVALFICMGVFIAGGNCWGGRNKLMKPTKAPSTPRQTNRLKEDYFASIVQMPSVFHKCNAFFVTNQILIAPASCVTCDEVCNFQVKINAISVRHEAKFMDVKNITLHPKFLKYTSHGNPSFNIAVVQLKEPSQDVVPLKISRHLPDTYGYVRSWKFNSGMTDFRLKSYIFEKVSQHICDDTISPKVDEICIQGEEAVGVGKFNEGSVFVVDDDDHTKPSQAVAFLSESIHYITSKYYAFVSIPYYYDWLNTTITKMSQ